MIGMASSGLPALDQSQTMPTAGTKFKVHKRKSSMQHPQYVTETLQPVSQVHQNGLTMAAEDA